MSNVCGKKNTRQNANHRMRWHLVLDNKENFPIVFIRWHEDLLHYFFSIQVGFHSFYIWICVCVLRHVCHHCASYFVNKFWLNVPPKNFTCLYQLRVLSQSSMNSSRIFHRWNRFGRIHLIFHHVRNTLTNIRMNTFCLTYGDFFFFFVLSLTNNWLSGLTS